jgi:hypothetical protein
MKIPLDEMLEDLKTTEKEIDQLRKENDILRKDYQKNRVAIYMNEGRILQRQDFVERLQKLITEIYIESDDEDDESDT